MSTIKVDNLDTRTGTGNITLNRPLVGDGSGLTSLTAANLTGTIHADRYTDTVYTHPTTAGNKHIPTAGATDQVLTYSSSGTAQWAAPAAGGVDGITSSADATAITIDSSERVGIGTTAPVKPLHVMETSAGAETVPLVLTNHSSTAGTAVSLGFGAVGSTDHYSKIQSQRNGSGDWDFSLWNANASGVLTERLTISKNGYVGIGTTAPAKQFVVDHATNVDGIDLLNSDTGQSGRNDFRFMSSAVGSGTTNNRNWAILQNCLAWGDLAISNTATRGADPSTDINSRLYFSYDGRIFSDSTTWAWAHFHGQLATIQKSSNVSSLTDVGTGTWRLNYTTNARDNNHGTVANGQDGTGNSATQYAVGAGPYNAGAIAVTARTIGGTLTDVSYLCAVSYSA
jgi:hypothetical protein